MRPYYEADGITIYHGDCREVAEWLCGDVMVTDPPYGIAYKSGKDGSIARSIANDEDTSLRDWAIAAWGDRAAICFGTWRRSRPIGCRALLVWDTKGALGMGDLSLPWKPSHQEIYVMGSGFSGKRTTDVLSFAPVQSMAANGRVHPHQKPTDLMQELVAKCPDGAVADPFMGSGSTLVAAKALGRTAIGVELDERYCEIAAERLGQMSLLFAPPAPEGTDGKD